MKPFSNNRKSQRYANGRELFPTVSCGKEESEMFDGFGLFGTGIGTGLFGKIEDLVLGAILSSAM